MKAHTTGFRKFFSFKIYHLLKIHKTFKQHETHSLEYMQDMKRISEPVPVTRETEHIEQLVTILGSLWGEREGRKKTDESEFCLYPCIIKIFWPDCYTSMVFLNTSHYSSIFSALLCILHSEPPFSNVVKTRPHLKSRKANNIKTPKVLSNYVTKFCLMYIHLCFLCQYTWNTGAIGISMTSKVAPSPSPPCNHIFLKAKFAIKCLIIIT